MFETSCLTAFAVVLLAALALFLVFRLRLDRSQRLLAGTCLLFGAVTAVFVVRHTCIALERCTAESTQEDRDRCYADRLDRMISELSRGQLALAGLAACGLSASLWALTRTGAQHRTSIRSLFLSACVASLGVAAFASTRAMARDKQRPLEPPPYGRDCLPGAEQAPRALPAPAPAPESTAPYSPSTLVRSSSTAVSSRTTKPSSKP